MTGTAEVASNKPTAYPQTPQAVPPLRTTHHSRQVLEVSLRIQWRGEKKKHKNCTHRFHSFMSKWGSEFNDDFYVDVCQGKRQSQFSGLEFRFELLLPQKQALEQRLKTRIQFLTWWQSLPPKFASFSRFFWKGGISAKCISCFTAHGKTDKMTMNLEIWVTGVSMESESL